jgi:hypothetical protein
MPFTMTNRIPIHEQNRELASSKKDDERKQIKKYVPVHPKSRISPFFKNMKPNLEIDEAKVGLIVLHPAHQNHVPQGIELGPARKQPVL